MGTLSYRLRGSNTMLRLLPLLGLAAALPMVPSDQSSAGSLADFDTGLQFKFATVRTNAGVEYTGQIIGVYNEAHFMWNPSPYSTLALFVCSDPTIKLGHFSVQPGNYAWDIGALNTNMMSYSGLGRLNTNYAVWGKNVQLPMA